MTLWHRPTQPELPNRASLIGRAQALVVAIRKTRLHGPTVFTVVLLLVVLVYCCLQYVQYQADLASWDVLFLSGILTFLVGYRLALTIPERLGFTLTRLQHRNVLGCDVGTLAVFQHGSMRPPAPGDAASRSWSSSY